MNSSIKAFQVKSISVVLAFLAAALLVVSCRKKIEVTVVHPMPASVCFTGDVMLSRGVRGDIEKYGVEYPFANIKSTLEKFKYRFINLECPITPLKHPPNKPFSFRADSGVVEALKFAGITHATLANNHIDDQTKAGATDTYNILSENGIVPIGLKLDRSASCLPAEIVLSNRKIVVFGALGIKMDCSNIWYCRDSVFQQSVAAYKKKNPSAFVICYFHWGVEYQRFPSHDQMEVARKMIDLGADMIIGHHPHVIESIQYYKGKLILFSLGNLVFDQHDPDAKEGIIADLNVLDTNIVVDLIPYNIKEDRPVPLQPEEMRKFKELLLKISNGVSLLDEVNSWRVTENQETGASRQEPFNGPRRKSIKK